MATPKTKQAESIARKESERLSYPIFSNRSVYRCKIDQSHTMPDLGAAIKHVIIEAAQKGLDGSRPIGEYLQVLDTVSLERSEWNMILEMFATIDEQAGLAGDMLKLYNRLKEQIPK